MGDGISQETGYEDIRKRMSFYLGEVGGGHKTSRSLSLKEAEDAFRYIFEGKSSAEYVNDFETPFVRI